MKGHLEEETIALLAGGDLDAESGGQQGGNFRIFPGL
jgi:hypothetical protein